MAENETENLFDIAVTDALPEPAERMADDMANEMGTFDMGPFA